MGNAYDRSVSAPLKKEKTKMKLLLFYIVLTSGNIHHTANTIYVICKYI